MDWLPTLTPRRRRQLWYAPALAVAMGLTMVRLLVMARLLDVPAFASYSAGLLMSSTFCMVSCLGLQSLLQREWPIYALHGQRRRALVRAAQCAVLMAPTATMVVALAWTGVATVVMTPLLMAVGVWHGVAQQAFLVASTGSRSEGDALGYSIQQLTRSALVFAAGVAVASWLGRPLFVLAVEAAVAAILAIGTLGGALRQAQLGWLVSLRLAMRRLRRIPWRTSLLSMAVMLAAFAIVNLDRWVAARELAPAAFGQYSFAAIVLVFAQAAQALINTSVYPLLARRFAEHGQAAVFRICMRATVGLATVGFLLAVPAATTARYAVATWYPDYQPAATLLPMLTMVGVLRLCDFSSSYLMITGREGRMLAVNLTTLMGGAAVWLLWLQLSSDGVAALEQVAWLAAALSAVGTVAATGAAWVTHRSPAGAR